MRREITIDEIKERTDLNYNRLETAEFYQIDRVFSPMDYDWYGDLEGRSLLAFVSHYKISGKKIPCMEQMMSLMPSKLNEKGYIGLVFEDVIHEQQLSGHSWLLRGLCEHYEQFEDKFSYETVKNIVENLYLPLTGKIHTYPVDRSGENNGGVSGSSADIINGWHLSSDIGCVFMSIDGLSHAYKITKDERIKALLDEMICTYTEIDKARLEAQTHCTLTSARGMLRMFDMTGEKAYLEDAIKIYDLYVNGGGMTYTYQNLNWWNRPKSWSEPCAIVDSLMVATELYKITGDEKYRTTAARIYHNGFASMQRSNGCAGPDKLVCDGSENAYLSVSMYDAWFCCSMRLAEGLWYLTNNYELLYAEQDGTIIKNENGIYTDGDLIYCGLEEDMLKYADEMVEIDGIKLCPIVKMWRVPDADAKAIKMQIIF